MKQKRALALAIYHPDCCRLLLVQRPSNDEDLPNAWGLPASSLREGEAWAAAAVRTGREKLGVELALGPLVGQGSRPRRGYLLVMQEFEARILSGSPQVPQPVDGITQYQAWKWGKADELRPAARQGSLCSQLYLENQGLSY